MGYLLKGHQQHFFRGQFQGQVCSILLSNNLEAKVECVINKFAGDTKLGDAVHSLDRLQRDQDIWEHWEIINGMKFNKNKCRILHLEWSDARHKCNLEDEYLERSLTDRDLEVLVDSRLNMSQL